jgi:hypothetical protein
VTTWTLFILNVSRGDLRFQGMIAFHFSVSIDLKSTLDFSLRLKVLISRHIFIGIARKRHLLSGWGGADPFSAFLADHVADIPVLGSEPGAFLSHPGFSNGR